MSKQTGPWREGRAHKGKQKEAEDHEGALGHDGAAAKHGTFICPGNTTAEPANVETICLGYARADRVEILRAEN